MKLATWEDGGLTSQRPSSPSRWSQRVLKGEGMEEGREDMCSIWTGASAVSHMWTWSWKDLLALVVDVFKCSQALFFGKVWLFITWGQWFRNLKESRLVFLQNKGLRSVNKEGISLKQVNFKDWLSAVTRSQLSNQQLLWWPLRVNLILIATELSSINPDTNINCASHRITAFAGFRALPSISHES